MQTDDDDTDYPPLRAFVFAYTDDPSFPGQLPDLLGDHYQFAAMCEPIGDPLPDDGYNLFVALNCDDDDQARDLADQYFHSTLVFGRKRGVQGLKHI